MTFILVSGKSGVGKTAVCNRLHGMLDQNGTFTMRYERSSDVACREDHIRLYEKDKKHIVVSSASDGDKCMLEFAKYLDSLAKKPDIIVTTIREKDDIKEEYPMSRMFALLDAIADGTPNLENYHKQNIESVTSFSPMSLCHNAFVLHLEKQNVSGVDNKDKALAQYCDGKAETAKQMLDLALARL